MLPQTVSFRPQTSRQARRAYQKAGGTPRLSALEKRRLERSAELQERAARIRTQDERARENKRKKAEKQEKERETRKRMGIPEPTKFSVGASQLSLGDFVSAGIKRKREETDGQQLSLEDCPNIGDMVANPDAVKPAEITSRPSKSPPQIQATAETEASKTKVPPREMHKATFATAASLMPPPPPRASMSNTARTPMGQPIHQARKDNAVNAVEIDWDLMFDSNTQVERELSDTMGRPSASISDPTPLLKKRPDPPSLGQLDLLADISTQDLQYPSSPSQPPLSPERDKQPRKSRSHQTHARRHKGSESSAEHPNGTRSARRSASKASRPVLLPSDLPTSPMKKQRPNSALRSDELDVIILALQDNHCVWLSRLDVNRLIAGHHLSGLASHVPPWLVTKMAIKLEEVRQKGQRLWSANMLQQWAAKMQQIEGPARRKRAAESSAAALAELRKEAVAAGRLDGEGQLIEQPPVGFQQRNADVSLSDPPASDMKAVSASREVITSKPVDEFDEFEVSSQDLRELDL